MLDREEIFIHEMYWRTLRIVRHFLAICKNIEPPELQDISNPSVDNMAQVLNRLSEHIGKSEASSYDEDNKRITIDECASIVQCISQSIGKYKKEGTDEEALNKDISRHLADLELLVDNVPTSYI